MRSESLEHGERGAQRELRPFIVAHLATGEPERPPRLGRLERAIGSLPQLPRTVQRAQRGRRPAGGQPDSALRQCRGGFQRLASVITSDLHQLVRGRLRRGEIFAGDRDLNLRRQQFPAHQAIRLVAQRSTNRSRRRLSLSLREP